MQTETLHKAETGRKIARVLADAAFLCRPENRIEIAILAARILECNKAKNIVHIDEFVDRATGEIFSYNNTLWSCGSKLCPQCVSRQARKNRRKLRSIIEIQRLGLGERFRFITLTVPNPAIDLLETRAILNAAWAKLRKLTWFKKTFIGYCKSEEFTVTKNGFHYHIHVLARARYIDYTTIRYLWTECVRSEWQKKFDEELSPATADRLLIVNVMSVSSRERSIQEVCKYLTKSDSWQSLSLKTLLDVASVERWHRMFELGGTFRSVVLPTEGIEKIREQHKKANKYLILDTECLSDGTQAEPPEIRQESWRKNLQRLPLRRFLLRMMLQIRNCQAARIRQLSKFCDVELAEPDTIADARRSAALLYAWISTLE